MSADDALLKGLRSNAATLASTFGPDSERLVERARDAGLLDVAYTVLPSPVGPLVAASTAAGLVRLAFADSDPDAVIDEIAGAISVRVLRSEAALAPVAGQLAEYFAGRRKRFSVPVDWQLCGGFRRAVLQRVAAIPFGTVRSYGEVAEAAGRPRAARAAGQALAANPVCIVVPCHRVVPADRGVGGYAGGAEAKRLLLALEGSDRYPP